MSVDYRKQTRLPARGQANGSTSAPTTTSGTFAVIAEMTVTITTQGGDVQVTFNGDFNVQNGDSFDIAVFTDTVEQTGTRRHVEFFGGSLLGLTPANIPGIPLSLTAFVTGLAAGSHTFDVRWARTAGTARAFTTQRNIQALEVF